MKRTYIQQEKDLVFDLWKEGAGFSDISRVIDAKPSSIFTILCDQGGIKPDKRIRANHHLTNEEREKIRVGLSENLSIRAIARKLNRTPSTISREVNRNKSRRCYKAVDADIRAWKMAKRPKLCMLASNKALRKVVIQNLNLKWSPAQISGWLKINFPGRKNMNLSHDSIYKTLYIRARKTLHHSLVLT